MYLSVAVAYSVSQDDLEWILSANTLVSSALQWLYAKSGRCHVGWLSGEGTKPEVEQKSEAEVKQQAQRAASWKLEPKGPLDFYNYYSSNIAVIQSRCDVEKI